MERCMSKFVVLVIGLLTIMACGKNEVVGGMLYDCPPPVSARVSVDRCVNDLANIAVTQEANAMREALPPKVEVSVPTPEVPAQLELYSAKFVPTNAPDEQGIALQIPDRNSLDDCLDLVASLSLQMLGWEKEYQNGISSSKAAQSHFTDCESIHDQCASLMSRYIKSNQGVDGLKKRLDKMEVVLEQLRLGYAQALYTLATLPDYPVGFPYTESYRHTTVDQLVDFLKDTSLTPDQVQADLTGAALAKLRQSSFQELFQILRSPVDRYTAQQEVDALIGLCTEIRKGSQAQIETGLTPSQILTIECGPE